MFTSVLGTLNSFCGNIKLGYAGDKSSSLNHNLSFSQFSSNSSIRNRLFQDSLSLSLSLSFVQSHTKSLLDSLSFSDLSSFSHDNFRLVFQSLSLSEFIHNEAHYDESISQSLTFSDESVFFRDNQRTFFDFLIFNQASDEHKLYSRTILQTLPLIQQFPLSIPKSIIQSISFIQTLSCTDEYFALIDDHLSFSQNQSQHTWLGRSISQTLILSDLYSRTTTYQRFQLNTLNLSGVVLVNRVADILGIVIPNPFPQPDRYADPNIQITFSGKTIILPFPLYHDSRSFLSQAMINGQLSDVYRVNFDFIFSLDSKQYHDIENLLISANNQCLVLFNWKYQAYVGFSFTKPVILTGDNSSQLIGIQFDGVRM